MNCHDFDRYLQEQLDSVVETPSPELSLHLAGCGRCRDLHQTAKLLETGLKAMPWPMPRLNLTNQIVRAVQADRRKRVMVRYRILVAAAAVLLVVVPLLGFWMTAQWQPDAPAPQGPGPGMAIIIPKPIPVPKPKDPPESKPQPELKLAATEAGKAVASLTNKLAEKTSTGAKALWSLAKAADFATAIPVALAEPVEEPAEPVLVHLQEARAGVQAGVQMVTSSTQRAVGMFVQECPKLKDRDRPQ